MVAHRGLSLGNKFSEVRKLGLLLPVYADETNVVKNQNIDCVDILLRGSDFEDPAPLVDQVYVGCMQRKSESLISKRYSPKPRIRKMCLLFSKWQYNTMH